MAKRQIQFINVRIGLGSEPYRINKEDIPLLKRFLQKLEDNSI